MIIGLTGKARAGKDTVADLITAESLGSVHRVGFADLLKLSAARALNVLTSPDDVGIEAVRRWADALKTRHRIQIVDQETDEVIHSLTGRQFLQRYGTEAHRDLFGDDFWVEAVELNRPEVDVLILNDVRFANEAAAIKEAGGEVWRVVRDTIAVEDNATERPLPSHFIDREIENYGSIDDLRAKVQQALVTTESVA